MYFLSHSALADYFKLNKVILYVFEDPDINDKGVWRIMLFSLLLNGIENVTVMNTSFIY